MSDKLRLAHITDIHIGQEGQKPYDVDVRFQFLKVLEDIRKVKVDCIIITGDLCFRTPEENLYLWIREKLNKTSVSYHVIPGNHDNRRLMKRIFAEKCTILCGFKEMKGKRMIFFDTREKRFPFRQRRQLLKLIKGQEGNSLIFSHYPPCRTGFRYMDRKYYFRKSKAFLSLAGKLKLRVPLFCGHYHNEGFISVPNFDVYVTPSTFFQLDRDSYGFKVEHTTPGWRLIEWDCQIHTEVC